MVVWYDFFFSGQKYMCEASVFLMLHVIPDLLQGLWKLELLH